MARPRARGVFSMASPVSSSVVAFIVVRVPGLKANTEMKQLTIAHSEVTHDTRPAVSAPPVMNGARCPPGLLWYD